MDTARPRLGTRRLHGLGRLTGPGRRRLRAPRLLLRLVVVAGRTPGTVMAHPPRPAAAAVHGHPAGAGQPALAVVPRTTAGRSRFLRIAHAHTAGQRDGQRGDGHGRGDGPGVPAARRRARRGGRGDGRRRGRCRRQGRMTGARAHGGTSGSGAQGQRHGLPAQLPLPTRGHAPGPADRAEHRGPGLGPVLKVPSFARRAGLAVSGACDRKAEGLPGTGCTGEIRQRGERACQAPQGRRDFEDRP